MGARCKALCKWPRFHYRFVTNFRRCERADVYLNSTVAPDAMSRSFGAAPMADSQGTAIVQFVRRAIGPTEDPTPVNEEIFGHLGLRDMSLSWQCGWRTMSPIGTSRHFAAPQNVVAMGAKRISVRRTAISIYGKVQSVDQGMRLERGVVVFGEAGVNLGHASLGCWQSPNLPISHRRPRW
jgi:hypothetical protein